MRSISIAWMLIVIPIISVLVGGWAISVIWGWFIVPIFGLPVISWATGAGISLLFSLLKVNYESSCGVENIKEVAVSMTVMAVLVPLYALVIGWLLKHFVS